MRYHGASTHRWTFTVVLLVSLASLPTLAAISAGSATLGQTAEPDGTTPFIAQPSGVPIVIVPQPTLLLPPPAQTGPAVATHHGRPGSAKPRREGDRTRAPRAERSHSERRRIGGSPARPRTPGPDSIELHQACKRPAALGWRPLLQQTPAPRCGPGGR